MSEGDKYNGWTNYATWRIQLELVDDYVSSIDGEDAEAWSHMEIDELADVIKEYVDETLTGFGMSEHDIPSITLDYARAFVSDCNWYEMAENAQENAREQMEYNNR